MSGHSKLAGMLLFKNYADSIGMTPEEILKKPVEAGIRGQKAFFAKNGLNAPGALGLKLSRALNADVAGSTEVEFPACTGGAIQRAVESAAGFAHSAKEAEEIIGQAALGQAMGYVAAEREFENWKALAQAGTDKKEALIEQILLKPEQELDFSDLAAKFNRKNWKKRTVFR